MEEEFLNSRVLQLFQCPVCHASLQHTPDQRSCRCDGTRSHCFDFAKSGYLNLVGAQAKEGDSKEAVQARRLFLERDYYQPLVEHILSVLEQIPSETLLDAGCGEGYYTNRFARAREVVGIDLSKAGIDYAARRAKQAETGAGFAVASLFEMPVKTAAFDVVTNLFAPLCRGGVFACAKARRASFVGWRRGASPDGTQGSSLRESLRKPGACRSAKIHGADRGAAFALRDHRKLC